MSWCECVALSWVENAGYLRGERCKIIFQSFFQSFFSSGISIALQRDLRGRRGKGQRVSLNIQFFLFLVSGPTRKRDGANSGFRKILTTFVSTFTSYYVHLWASYFPDKKLSTPIPSFDGRVVQYPSAENLRDYLSWRQVDCMF